MVCAPPPSPSHAALVDPLTCHAFAVCAPSPSPTRRPRRPAALADPPPSPTPRYHTALVDASLTQLAKAQSRASMFQPCGATIWQCRCLSFCVFVRRVS